MENNAQQSSYDPSQMSVALTAASMINASDMIPSEVYQANLQRIDEMKDIVRRLEQNNDEAHKNFLMDQLEKRIKEGREAEEVLQRLRTSNELPESLKAGNQPPIAPQVDVVPSTATLVEVQDNLSTQSTSLSSAQPGTVYSAPSVYPYTYQQYYALPQTTTRSPAVQMKYNMPYAPPNTYAYYPAHTRPQQSQPMQHTYYAPQYNPRTTSGSAGMGSHLPPPQINATITQQSSANYYRTQPTTNAPSSHMAANSPPASATVTPATYYAAASPQVQPRPTNTKIQSMPYVQDTFSTAQGSTPVSYVTSVSTSAPAIPTLGYLPQPPKSQFQTVVPTGVSSASQPPAVSSNSQPLPQSQVGQRSFPSVSQTSLASQVLQENGQSYERKTSEQQLRHPSRPVQQPRQLQQPAGTRSQPPISKDAFIRAFQSAMLLGPQKLASFIVQAVGAGIGAPWFHEAICTVPTQAWNQQLSELPKYLPANFLFRPSTSSQSSVPPPTGANPATSVSHTMRTASTSVQPPRTIQLKETPSLRVHAVESQTTVPHSATVVDPATVPQIQSYSGHTAMAASPPQVSTTPAPTLVPSSNVPATPERNNELRQPTSRTPQQADRRRLAYDILRSLGRQIPTFSSKQERGKITKANGDAPSHTGPIGAQSVELPGPTMQQNGNEEAEKASEQNVASSPTPAGNGATESLQEPLTQLTVEIERSGDQPASYTGPRENHVTELPQEPTVQQIVENEPVGDLTVAHTKPGGNYATQLPQDTMPQAIAKGEEMEQVSHQVASHPTLQEPIALSHSHMPVVQPALEPGISTPPPLAPQPTNVTPPEVEPVPPEVQVNSTTDMPIVIDLTLDEMDSERSTSIALPQNPPDVSARSASRPQQDASAGRQQLTPTPQFQSLSLEEPRVEPLMPAGVDDIRMATPSPQPPEVEHIPPQDSEIPVVESYLRIPSSVEELIAVNDRLPLFLPSPPSSPIPERSSLQPPPDTDEDDVILLDETSSPSPSRKRRSVGSQDIEVDEASSVVRLKKRRKQLAYVLIPSPPPYVKGFKELSKRKDRTSPVGVDLVAETTDEEDADSELQYSEPEPFRYLEAEQVMINSCNTQLMERSCNWRYCDAILSCGDTLLAHLERHAHEDSQEPLGCRWEGCRKKFRTDQQRLLHLRRHAIIPLPCPFTGCSESFDEPLQVMCHEVEDHPYPLPRQPRSLPYLPSLPPRLGPPPRQLPSHRVIPRRIRRVKISPERHAIVGPWVLWNIFGPVELSARRQNVSMRVRPTTDEDGDKGDARADEYDFLLPLSAGSKRVTPLEDLDSPLVTQMVARGLLLWGQVTQPYTAKNAPSINQNIPVEVSHELYAPVSAPPLGNVDEGAVKNVLGLVDPVSVDMAETGGADESYLTAASGEDETVKKMLILS